MIYNGVDLFVLETYAFDCESVYDDSGMNYLYTKVSIAVRAIINGQNLAIVNDLGIVGNGPFMSYDFSGSSGQLQDGLPSQYRKDPQGAVDYSGQVLPNNTGTVPNATGIDRQLPSRLRSIAFVPSPAGTTHQAIRHRLATPRGRLYIFSGPGMESGTPQAGEKDPPGKFSPIIVESPSKDPETKTVRPCDCKNGPFPKVLSIQMVLGDATTFMVDWSCETYINEGPDNGVDPSGILLSNNFSQTHAIDDDSYTTITTTGAAVFRADLVQDLPMSPDASRPLLFIPIPQGFVRENIVVTGRNDVTGVDYSFQDRQVPINFPAGPYSGAMKIAAVHRQSVSSSDVLEGALSVYQSVLGLKVNRNFAKGDDAGRDEKSYRRFIRDLRRAIRPRARKAPIPPAAPGGAPGVP